MRPRAHPASWDGIYYTAAELHGVVDTDVKAYIDPQVYIDFAEEMCKRAEAAKAADDKKTTAPIEAEGGAQ